MVPQMGMHSYPGTVQPGSATPMPRALVIKLGVEELRTLIYDAVQKAVQGLQAQKSPKGVTVDAEMGEGIAVADGTSSAVLFDAEIDPQQTTEE